MIYRRPRGNTWMQSPGTSASRLASSESARIASRRSLSNRMPTEPPLDPQETLGVAREAMPRHIAIIMDGNGRWARQRGLPRIEGHRNSSTAVRETVTQCARLGVQAVSLYSFSLENWKRPRPEVEGLMALYAQYLAQERTTIMDNDIRCIQIGRRDGLPPEVLRELDLTLD